MAAEPARRLEWTKRAITDLIATIDHIYDDSPRSAVLVKNRVLQAAQTISDYPEVETPGRVSRTREYSVPHTSLTVIYRVKTTVVQVVPVLHQRDCILKGHHTAARSEDHTRFGADAYFFSTGAVRSFSHRGAFMVLK